MEEVAMEQTAERCGFCLRHGSLDDPKSLPCTHVHCLVCLTESYRINGILRCPWCREVYNVPINSLPSATLGESTFLCDVCTKKDAPANMYCTICPQLLCVTHGDQHEGHQKMPISEYRIQAKRLERRVCPEHAEFSCSLGCKVCVKLFCVQCDSGASQCLHGSSHQLVAIDELIKALAPMDGLLNREEKLGGLFKQISKAVTDFDIETESMLTILHQQRDEQLAGVRLKYEALEAEFLANRGKTKADLTRYMEEQVGTLWSDLSKNRMKIEAQLRQMHQVDIVREHAAINDKIQKLVSVELPKLDLCEIPTLEIKAQERAVEVEPVFAADIFISLNQGVTTSGLPTSMKLVGTINFSDKCYAVCSYQSKTYLGLCQSLGIDMVDENFIHSKAFLPANRNVNCVTSYKDRLYALVYGDDCNVYGGFWYVNVYDLSGTMITRWGHHDTTGSVSKLAVVDDKVVVPDRTNRILTLYTLKGKLLQHIPCPLLGSSTSMCTVDKGCVVICNTGTSQVFKFDLKTAQLIWKFSGVSNPQGVTYYRGQYVLVTSEACDTTIWILDVETGTLLGELKDSTNRKKSDIYDLSTSGSTLVVPRNDGKEVLFYQLS